MSLLKVDYQDCVAVLTLNDPERRNVVSLPLVDEIDAAMGEIEAGDAINAVVVTGMGSAFCAGADLSDLEAASAGDVEGLKRIYRGFLRVAECPLPTIAAINGPAVGAGMNLALACDIRIAANAALFDTRFLALGLHPGGGHTWMLNRTVGWQASAAMLLLGQIIGGEEAVQAGLALRCVPDDQLLSAAVEMARGAVRFPNTLLRRTKSSMRHAVLRNNHADAVSYEYEHQLWSLNQPEFLEFLRKARARIRGSAGRGERP